MAVCRFLTAVASLLFQSTGSRAHGFQYLWPKGSIVVDPGLYSTGSVVVAHGISWDPPRPGIEPVTPALAGRFFYP